jgi:hypothetical protein
MSDIKLPSRVGRRRLFHASLAAGALAALPRAARGAAASPSPPALPGARPPLGSAGPAKKKVLFVYGGWPGHEPEKCRDLWVPWMKGLGWDVTVSDKLDPYADQAFMKSIDLVVQIWTQGTIANDQWKGLQAAIKNGTGIAGWHGGLGDAFRMTSEYNFMIGGMWTAHPGGIIDYGVQIVDHEDPLTAGIEDFKLRTEQYYMMVDPNNKVLATTSFSADHAPWVDGAVMPVVWKKVYGKGRVFYSSLGHTRNVFDVKEVFEITSRGLLWASESKYARTPNLVTPVYPRI